jgi:cyclophilin family peptidyl-prolyl cis-trans isomerase
MFKDEGKTWLYLVGILIMFGILLVAGRDFIIPFIAGDKDFNLGFLSDSDDAPDFDIDTSKDYFATIKTNYGDITIDLFEKAAPNNTNNFISLSKEGYYNQTKFHRLIKDFLLQGGDRNTLNTNPDDDGKGNPGYTIPDEINWDSLDLSKEKREELEKKGFSNTPNLESKPLERYSFAMANSGPNTNGSQFFIVISDFNDPRLSDLTGYFTVIGKVIAGFETLTTLSQIEVNDPQSNTPRPQKDIIINNIEIFIR